MHLVARENIDLNPTLRVRVGEVFICSDGLAAKYLGRRAARPATEEEIATTEPVGAVIDLELTPSPAPKRSPKPRAGKPQA